MIDDLEQVWLTDVQHMKTIRVIKLQAPLQELKAQQNELQTLKKKVGRCFMCKRYKLQTEMESKYSNKFLVLAKISLCRRGIQ